MSSDIRQASRGGARTKRRFTNAEPEDAGLAMSEEQNPKRQRVSRACDSCRIKKDKCDGAQPVCSTCAALSRPCTYKSNPKKRGLPTGYLRTLELLWGMVFSKVKNSEEVVISLLKSEDVLAHLTAKEDASDPLVSSWKNSAVLGEIERLLGVLKQEDDPDKEVRDLSPRDEGTVPTNLEWHLPGDLRQSQPIHSEPDRFIPQARSMAVQMTNSATQTAAAQEASTNPALPSDTWALLDTYFLYTQSWFPILEKHDILRTAFRCTEGDAQQPLPGESGEHATLWAVLTLASFQRTSQQDPGHLFAMAKSLVPTESGYDIGHVQTLLILALVKLGQRDWSAAWTLVGRAISIARYLELDSGKIPGRSKHVFLACFILDTLVATQLGIRPSLHKEDLAEVSPVGEDGLEEWQPWGGQLHSTQSRLDSFERGPLRALSVFNHLVSLVVVLNAMDRNLSMEKFAMLETQLHEWRTKLPKNHRITKEASPHIFILELAYNLVVISLSRLSGQRNGQLQQRTNDSLERLPPLLETYVEAHSMANISPMMVLIMNFCAHGSRDAAHSLDMNTDLKDKLQTWGSRIASVWLPQERTDALPSVLPSGNVNPDRAPASNPAVQGPDLRSLAPSGGTSTLEPSITSPWLRTPNTEDGASLTLQTPRPQLAAPLEPFGTSRQPSQPEMTGSASGRHQPVSLNTNATGILPDMAPPIDPGVQQYAPAPTYGGANPLDPFVDIDGFGPRRPRIAPDLDALFDELASLDGTEK